MITDIENVEKLNSELAPVVAQAMGITITEPQHYTEAADFLKAIKGAQKRVTDFFGPMKSKAHDAWKAITTTEAGTLKPLSEAEATVKRKMLTYAAEQERIRQEQERKLQAEADEIARRERARLEKEAAKLKTPELREARIEQAAAVVAPVVTVASVKPAVAGVSMKKTWKARLIDMQALTGIPAGDVRLTFVEFRQSEANRFASATKGAVKVQGVEFFEESSLSSSSR